MLVNFQILNFNNKSNTRIWNTTRSTTVIEQFACELLTRLPANKQDKMRLDKFVKESRVYTKRHSNIHHNNGLLG